MNDEASDTLRMVTVIVLGAVLVTAIIGLIIVAIFTDRDGLRDGVLFFAAFLVISAAGGVSWWSLHRRHAWRLRVDRNGHDERTEP